MYLIRCTLELSGFYLAGNMPVVFSSKALSLVMLSAASRSVAQPKHLTLYGESTEDVRCFGCAALHSLLLITSRFLSMTREIEQTSAA